MKCPTSPTIGLATVLAVLVPAGVAFFFASPASAQAPPVPSAAGETYTVEQTRTGATASYGETGPFQFRVLSFQVAKANEVTLNALQGGPWLAAQGEGDIALVTLHFKRTRKLTGDEVKRLKKGLNEKVFDIPLKVIGAPPR